MKKYVAMLVLLLFVAFQPDRLMGQDCERYSNEIVSIQEETQDLSRSLTGKTSMTEAEGQAFGQKMKALLDKSAAATKKYGDCLNMPSEAEAQKMMSDIKVQSQEATKQLESQVKQFAPQSIAGNGGGGGNSMEQTNPLSQTFSMLMAQEPEYKEAPVTGGGSLDGEAFRTPEEKAAALRAVNAELERLPVKLPKKEDAPNQGAILKLAAEYNAFSRKNFKPEDLSEYSQAVTWNPLFNGQKTNPLMAKTYSFSVSSVTNYFNKPYFVMAYATAVFSLDPKSPASANNLAAAIAIAGKRLYTDKTQEKNLVPFHKSAEAIYLHALAISMDKNNLTDASLVSLVNLGNLYIDMNRPDEARSLLQAARKQSPFSWDAALGMAAYFHSINEPDKARAILDDENLDRPQTLMVAKKASKALEKTKDLPIDSPEELYKENIKTIAAEPIATVADFMAQIDQSENNKMRYFVEHLPAQGSFEAPPIKKLTQYASLKAINGPQGQSALKDFTELLQNYAMSSFASLGKQQMKMLERLGLDVNINVDLDDVARNPEKYKNNKNRPKVKVDKSQILKKVEGWKKQAQTANNELATGKTGALTELISQVDPSVNILNIDPSTYADPMNIIIQKHNFAVHNRKSNLYKGYLHTINRRLNRQLNEILQRYNVKISEAKILMDQQLEQLAAQRKAAGSKGSSVEWDFRVHNIHVNYFNTCNNIAETSFGSAANITSVAYTQKIKPYVEAYYYDVIRHVALISDPDVRTQKDAELRQSIYSTLVYSLSMVGMAHSSFKYHDEWDCSCSLESLYQRREMEKEAQQKEEEERIQRNKAAKKAFESGEIPQSSPLFKKIDGYGFDFNYLFFKGRMSPARTVLHFNIKLPVPGSPEIFLSKSISEFTGAGTYGQGIKVSLGADQAGVKAGAYFNLSSSVSTDGQGVVQDYSVTAGTGLRVSSNNTTISVGGELTFGPGGVKDSNFSAGVKQDFKNSYGGEGDVSFEASTKQGCKFSSSVEQTLEGPGDFIKEAKTKAVGKDLQGLIPTDDLFKQKQEWSGKFNSMDK
jgi:hypothetical protein